MVSIRYSVPGLLSSNTRAFPPVPLQIIHSLSILHTEYSITKLPSHSLKPQLRPHKNNQNRRNRQPRNPRIQQHPSPPPSSLTHTPQHPHFLTRLLQPRRILVHALRRALHNTFLVFQGGIECLRGLFERLGHGEHRVRERFLLGAVVC